ncbi:hypothetical protein ABC347_02745 [Sphingomonas sp. 1P06PA]|uniref:hypothetical protein n=1 Tax=Sphingomonas sp. 1P06PA TaxID=554121 RepID=UPI0039A629D1
MARKLKVFRTATGFHDAYVAAPSRKAALAAWGTTKDLFARGVAEEVTDAALAAEPLTRPGEVITRSRGTTAEQLAALPIAKRRQPAAAADPAPKRKPEPRPKPKPSRAKLDTAEAQLSEARATIDRERAELAKREAELARERAAIERRHEAAIEKLEAARARAETAYAKAIERWQD